MHTVYKFSCLVLLSLGNDTWPFGDKNLYIASYVT